MMEATNHKYEELAKALNEAKAMFEAKVLEFKKENAQL